VADRHEDAAGDESPLRPRSDAERPELRSVVVAELF
jgi:hypothetical protein